MSEWLNGLMEMLNGKGLLLTAIIALCGTAVLLLFRRRLPFLRLDSVEEQADVPQVDASVSRAQREYKRHSAQTEEAPSEKDEEFRPAVKPAAPIMCPPELSRRIDIIEAKLKARSASQIG
ncbi:MAG: hypothetical protein GY835_20115 [bacterium]|nr:hypothetical protein [bacterium]